MGIAHHTKKDMETRWLCVFPLVLLIFAFPRFSVFCVLLILLLLFRLFNFLPPLFSMCHPHDDDDDDDDGSLCWFISSHTLFRLRTVSVFFSSFFCFMSMLWHYERLRGYNKTLYGMMMSRNPVYVRGMLLLLRDGSIQKEKWDSNIGWIWWCTIYKNCKRK